MCVCVCVCVCVRQQITRKHKTTPTLHAALDGHNHVAAYELVKALYSRRFEEEHINLNNDPFYMPKTVIEHWAPVLNLSGNQEIRRL